MMYYSSVLSRLRYPYSTYANGNMGTARSSYAFAPINEIVSHRTGAPSGRARARARARAASMTSGTGTSSTVKG